MKKTIIFSAFVACAMIGCKPESNGTNPEGKNTPSSPPVKMTARELYDAYKIGKSHDGKRVEVTGTVRAVEADRAEGKVVLEGGDMPLDRMEVYFEGKVSGVSRRYTITVTATVKSKVNDVLTLTDAKLVSVQKKKADPESK